MRRRRRSVLEALAPTPIAAGLSSEAVRLGEPVRPRPLVAGAATLAEVGVAVMWPRPG